MLELPLHPITQAVLDAVGPEVHSSELLREIDAQPASLGTSLARRLGPTTPREATVDGAALRAAAGAEALRLGAPKVGPEHLLLGLAALAAGNGFVDVTTARADLQALLGDFAGRAYETVEPLPARNGQPFAVVLAGLPGSGKSTLAEALAGHLGVAGSSLDWQLGALTPFGLVRPDNAVPLAYHLLTAAMAEQLRLGTSIVMDAGGHLRSARQRWRTVAENLGARFIGVECVCSDEELHRARVAGRARGIPGWPNTVSWDHVVRMRRRWEPWDEPHLVIHTVQPVADCLDQITAVVRAAS